MAGRLYVRADSPDQYQRERRSDRTSHPPITVNAKPEASSVSASGSSAAGGPRPPGNPPGVGVGDEVETGAGPLPMTAICRAFPVETYARSCNSSTAMWVGPAPTCTVANWFPAGSKTATESLPELTAKMSCVRTFTPSLAVGESIGKVFLTASVSASTIEI